MWTLNTVVALHFSIHTLCGLFANWRVFFLYFLLSFLFVFLLSFSTFCIREHTDGLKDRHKKPNNSSGISFLMQHFLIKIVCMNERMFPLTSFKGLKSVSSICALQFCCFFHHHHFQENESFLISMSCCVFLRVDWF